MLNTAKGPAVRALRMQSDKVEYQLEMKRILEDTPNLDIEQAMVKELIIENNKVVGLKTMLGTAYKAKTCYITTGTLFKRRNSNRRYKIFIWSKSSNALN